MYEPNKFAKFIKDSIMSIFTGIENSESFTKNNDTLSTNWSLESDKISINKIDYESLLQDNLNKTEIIEKLKKKSKEDDTLLLEYENTFNNIIEKGIGNNKNKGIKEGSFTFKKQKEEIERLKFSEERLKSHIKALKKEIITEKQNLENQNNLINEEFKNLKKEKEKILIENKNLKKQVEELIFENRENKILLDHKVKELVELVEITKILLKEV